VTLGSVYCPRCGDGPYRVLPGWRLAPHGPGKGCHGPECGRGPGCPQCADSVFDAMLDEHGLLLTGRHVGPEPPL
jgi:ribosomal protein S27AE